MGADSGYVTAHEFLPCVPLDVWKKQQAKRQLLQDKVARSDILGPMMSNNGSQTQQVKLDYEGYLTARQEESGDDGAMYGDDSDEEMDSDNEPLGHENEKPTAVDTKIRSNFQEYCKRANDFVAIPTTLMASIQLMKVLRQTKASLATYDTVMEWHLRTNGDIHPHESVGSCKSFYSRKKVFKYLSERYNMHENYNNLAKIVLPSSMASVNIVWSDAKMVLQSLLTDPRIKDEDYLFWGNDPLAPPQNVDYVGDLITGRAYIETYNKLITRPGEQVLLPTPLYIDGATTGQFADLPITAVKISLGIFNREARDKPHFWRNLGYIPPVTKDKSRGRRILIESGHLDATRAVQEAEENEGKVVQKGAHKAQDLHTMIDKIMESYVKLQESGFKWDLFYNGKLYKDIEFIPFVPFIKCDTDEADKLCGSFTSRTQNVAQLCRYCKCPTDDSDNPQANYPLKTKAQIQAMVNRKDLEGLKKLSQQYIQNATYKLQFGLHNPQGVHGATPLEMLHALLLGTFRDLRDVFYKQLGDTSKASHEFDALTKEYGVLLSRQSNRDKPKTKFYHGIRAGKLMAREYTGVLLLMLVSIRSGKGRQLLERKKKIFGPTGIADWELVIETLLEWEVWMKSDRMWKKHVRAAKRKHRYVM